jgi:DNA-binding MarR family transcriptional regulator
MKEQEIQQVRDFNRFYTNIIGLLDNHILNSPYSLPEARILYELYHQTDCTASKIMEIVSIDKAYLSRILASFQKRGMVSRKRSEKDARTIYLVLTAKGKAEFQKINQSSIQQVKSLLQPFSKQEVTLLIKKMEDIKKLLSKSY